MNPKELVISAAFFQHLAVESGFATSPHVRHYMTLTQYTKEKTIATAGQPGVAAFMELRDIVSLAKSTDVITLLESELKKARASYIPILEKQLAPLQARLEVAELADLFVRCALAKPYPAGFSLKGSGRFGPEKNKAITEAWAMAIDHRYPDLNFLKAANIESLVVNPDSKIMGEVIDTRSLKRARSNDDASDDEGNVGDKGLKIGDDVVVIRRFTVTVKCGDGQFHRKDVNEGTKALVKGYGNDKHTQFLINHKIEVPLKKPLDTKTTFAPKTKTTTQDFTSCTFPRNLELAEKYEKDEALKKADEKAKKAEEEALNTPEKTVTPGSSVKKYKWLWENIEEADRTEVKPDEKWAGQISDEDNLVRIYNLKSITAVGLHSMYQTLPTFSEKDFVLCHRQQMPKGTWHLEVWTSRAFTAGEILIGPMCTDIRDRMWSTHASVLIQLPLNGDSSHPEKKHMVLEGKGRQSIATPKLLDDEGHRGGLFWAITRQGDKTKEHNLTIETVTWEASMILKLPGGRKKSKVEMDSKDLPILPVMMNKKPIPIHTKLVVYQDLERLKKLNADPIK